MSMWSPHPRNADHIADGSVNNAEFETLDGIDTGQTIESRLAALEAGGGGGNLVDLFAVKTTAQTGFSDNAWTKLTGWTVKEGAALTSDAYVAPSDGSLVARANVPIWASTGSAITVAAAFAVNGTVQTDTMRVIATATGYISEVPLSAYLEVSEGDTVAVYVCFLAEGAGSSAGSFGHATWTTPDPDAVSVGSWEIHFKAA